MSPLELQVNLWKSISLLSIAVFGYGLVLFRLDRLSQKIRSSIVGLLFGSVGLLGMLIPVQVAPGIIVDGRVVIASLAGFFGGLPAAIVCATVVSVFRIALGGVGTGAGVGAIVGAAVIGIVLGRLRTQHNVWTTTGTLFLLGLFVALQALLWTLTLPWDIALPILKTFLLPIPITYTIATVLLGHLFLFESQRHEMEQSMREAKLRAEEASRAKSLFLANMSHEIRNPLNGIVGAVEVLEMTNLDEDQSKFLNVLKRASGSLLELVTEILDLSKIEAGIVEIEKRPFVMRDLVASVEELFFLQAKKKGLSLQTSVADSLPPVLMGDETKLRQILINLVGNALKFTDEGQVSLIVLNKTSPEDVRNGLSRVAFEVQDSGLGIPEAQHKKLFEPFQQGDLSSTKKHQGIGLGLTIAQQFVRAMGGELSIEKPHRSAVGARFVFELELQVALEVSLKMAARS